MKINIEKLYFRLILLFPITTLLQNNIAIVNKLLFAIIFILQCYFSFRKNTRKNFGIIFLIIAIFSYNLIITKGKLYNINELFYFPFTMLYIIYLMKDKSLIEEYLKNDKRYVNFILMVWTILVIISIFIPSSWPYEWGSEKYFGSYCKSVFRLAPTALFIGTLAICCMNVYHEKKYFIYGLIPLFCFLMGGSRTYMIVGLLLFVMAWYYYANSKKMFIMTIIPVTLILGVLILNSSMMDKFNAVTYTKNSYFDFWGTITSGRSIFWKADLEAFKDSAVVNKLFGNGFNYIYDVNYKAFRGLVWAHNDFIQILISHGLILLVIYISIMIKAFEINANKKDRIPEFLAIGIWIFNAFFNMFYTYFCAVLCLPFILLIIRHRNNNIEI